MLRVSLIILVLSGSIIAYPQKLKLSTPSDSALYFYYEGWRQVMDEGNYSKAEMAYRQMMKHDPDFLIGLSLLGRITKDLNERQQIELHLLNHKDEVGGDERILLNTFIDLVKLTNQRETNPGEAPRQMESIFKTGEQSLLYLVHHYPEEVYYKAEYIEVLHRNHGPQTALDSLYALVSQDQQTLPFLLGYAANLQAEIGQFTDALNKAEKLQQIMDTQSPKPYVVYSNIYFKMGKLETALEWATKALTFDPENIDAQRMMAKVKLELTKR